MADETANAIPPAPPTGEIVSEAALYNAQIALYRNTLAFGGVRNPTVIWSSMLRDDGTAMLYYRELEEKDTDVANGLETLKLSVLERAHSVTPADDTPIAAEIAEFIEAQLAQVPNFHAVLDSLLDAAGYGFALGEIIYDTSMGQASLVDIRDCPQELFLFGDRFQPQIGQLQFLTQPQASTGTIVPEEKFLIWSYRARSRNRMGRPLLRSVFWSSWFKRNMQRLWVRYGEKGPGTAVVRYQDANDPAQKQQAAALALALIEEVAVGVPQNFEFDKELLTIARSMDPSVYKDFYKEMQLDIARRILGETQTTFTGEGGKGTQASGKVHSDTLDRKSVELCRALQSVINRQLIRPLVLWNFGPNAPMPSWGYDLEEKEDLAGRLVIDTGLQRMGLGYTEAYVRERYQVPAPAADDVLLEPNVNAGQVNVADSATAEFAERTLDTETRGELAHFDRIERQLRDSSLGLMRQRIREVAEALKP